MNEEKRYLCSMDWEIILSVAAQAANKADTKSPNQSVKLPKENRNSSQKRDWKHK